MGTILEVVWKLFRGVDPVYLFKSYFFSLVLTILFIANVDEETSVSLYFYIIICGLLFPFATIVWDDLVGSLTQGTVIFLPIIIMLLWKFLKLTLLFLFTPFIAPIGFIYIYITNGYHKEI